MNWYTIAQLQNFEDRNIWNDKIDDLKAITVSLTKMAKLVYQTSYHTRQMLRDILSSKRLTSYPIIQQLLEAADKLALDSPHKFSALCKAATQELVVRVAKLEAERRDFINKDQSDKKDNKWKGWKQDD